MVGNFVIIFTYCKAFKSYLEHIDIMLGLFYIHEVFIIFLFFITEELDDPCSTSVG